METALQIIVQGCQKQHLHSQEALYRHFYPEMIKICFRYATDADGAGSIYNNAMLRVFQNIGSYKEEGKLGAWIKTIILNCCIDFCKKKNIFKNVMPYIAENDISIEPEIFEKVSYKEIIEFINQLPAATAIVFRLFVYEGLTHKQIAEQLNISDGTSKWHVSEAKRILKKKSEHIHDYNYTLNATG
ncbi:MAG: sigma-70 family RNA polymerase sigma factor [Ferruginibacter sp.]